MTGKTVHLRGHHLCCLLTYVGKGPHAGFIRHLDAVASQISRNAQIHIVRGADDICTSSGVSYCPFFPRCTHNSSMEKRDELMLSALSLMPGGGFWEVGVRRTMNEGMVWRFREAARHGAFSDVCRDCAYDDLCRCVAARGFDGVRLFPAKPASVRGLLAGGAACAM